MDSDGRKGRSSPRRWFQCRCPVPLEIARKEFRTLLIYLGIVFLGCLAVLNAGLYFTIAEPVARLSDMANRISLGDLEVPELSRQRTGRNRGPRRRVQSYASQPGDRHKDARRSIMSGDVKRREERLAVLFVLNFRRQRIPQLLRRMHPLRRARNHHRRDRT